MFRSAMRAVSAITVWLLASCVDGPFARANPYDPKAEVEMRLESSADTLSAVGDLAEFVLVTSPAYPQYEVQWSNTYPAFLEHLGNGVYRVRALPSVPTVVTVTVGWELRRTSASIVVMP